MPRKRKIDERPSKHEEKVMREHFRTHFEYDIGTRAMFHDDFESYFATILDPKLMEQRLAERLKELETQSREAPETFFDTRADFETNIIETAHEENECIEDTDEFEKRMAHPIVQFAKILFEHTHAIIIDWYTKRGERPEDVDAYRAYYNVFILPAKLFAIISSPARNAAEKDFVDAQTRIIHTFLNRAIESFERLASRTDNIALPAKLLALKGIELKNQLKIFFHP